MQPAPSKISAQSEKKPHYGQLWDDIADNQRMLADCELRFLIKLCRQGWSGPVSEQTWKISTGLHPRMRNRAIAGLRKKGLVVTGEGKAARYTFDRREWAAYTHRNRDMEVKARTEGRKVCAKPGQQIHPVCRDRGCQRLCEEKAVIPINSITAPPNQTPMSGIDSNSPPVSPPFPLTLSKLRALFPATTEDMPAKIAAACEAQGVTGFSDEQLSNALEPALRPGQKSAGLFPKYVPGALCAVMNAPKIAGTRQSVQSNSEVIRQYLERTSAALRAANLTDLAQMIDALSADSDQEILEDQLQRIETIALEGLPVPDDLDKRIAHDLKHYGAKLAPEQFARLRDQFRRREILRAAGLGNGISLFCV